MKSPAKVLVLSYPGCIMFEVMLASELLGQVYKIEIATPDGSDLNSTTGMVFKAQHSYDSVNARDYACVLVPGGDPYEVMQDKNVDLILQTASANGVPIGAICAGPVLLAKAGILKGRQFTHGYGEHHKELLAPYWQGAEFQDMPVVEIDNIVTAKPEAYVDFAIAICKLAGAITDDGMAEYYSHFYKGDRIARPATSS